MPNKDSSTEEISRNVGLVRAPVCEHDRLLRAREVAQLLGVREKRIYELGIPEVRLSTRSVRWRYATVIDWIEAHTREAA